MASSNKKKIEEENNLKTLREIVALQHNKHCFDCNQRGPTYVNMTIGSFVCTACSGLLRGLNPPHRVKSISMASFSNDEMEFIKSRGNEFCRKVWLGMYDRKTPMEVDSKDEGKMKDSMSQRYEKKRWYVHPPESLFEEARRKNTASRQAANVSIAKPLSSLVAGLPLSANAPSSLQRAHTNRPNSEPSNLSIPIQSPTAVKVEHSPKKQFDILADFGSDPFTTPARNSGPQQQTEGFADFSAFNAFSQPTQSLFSQPTWTPQMPVYSSNISTGILQPNTGTNPPAVSNQTAGIKALNMNSDKYSALASLDGETSVFGSSAVDWDGKRKSTGWTPSSSNQSIFGQAPSSQSQPPSYNSLNFTSIPNPFGVAAPGPMSGGHRPPVPNPFMAVQQQTQQMPAYFPHAFPAVPQAHGSFASPSTSHSSGPFGGYPQAGVAAFTQGGVVRPVAIASNGPSQTWGVQPLHSQVPVSWGAPQQMQANHNPFLGAKAGAADPLGSKNPYNPFL